MKRVRRNARDIGKFAADGVKGCRVWPPQAPLDEKDIVVTLWNVIDAVVCGNPKLSDAFEAWCADRQGVTCVTSCLKFAELQEQLLGGFDRLEECRLSDRLGSFFCYSLSADSSVARLSVLTMLLKEFAPVVVAGSRCRILEPDVKTANVAVPTEAVWIFDVSDGAGRFVVVVPLHVAHNLSQAKFDDSDKEPTQMQEKDGPTVRAILGESGITKADVGKVRVGDLLVLNKRPEQPVVLEVDGRIVGEGFLVVAANSVAVRVCKINCRKRSA